MDTWFFFDPLAQYITESECHLGLIPLYVKGHADSTVAVATYRKRQRWLKCKTGTNKTGLGLGRLYCVWRSWPAAVVADNLCIRAYINKTASLSNR